MFWRKHMVITPIQELPWNIHTWYNDLFSVVVRIYHIDDKAKTYQVETGYNWPFGQWYHILMTYKDGLGLSVYADGCILGRVSEAEAKSFVDKGTGNGKRLTLGCGHQLDIRHCSDTKMDDLYIWHGHKTDVFAYHLYTLYGQWKLLYSENYYTYHFLHYTHELYFIGCVTGHWMIHFIYKNIIKSDTNIKSIYPIWQ